MKTSVIQWWKHRRPLSRRAKVCRNLLVGAVLLVVFWGLKQYPLPTMDMEFRRLERSSLVEPTQIVLRLGRITQAHFHDPGTPAPEVTREQILGLGEGYAVTFWQHPFSPSGNQLDYWPFDEQEGQAKLVPLISFFSDTRGADWSERETCVGVAVFRIPEGTAWGEMTVEAEEGPYRGESQVLEPGLCLFSFQRRLDSYSGNWQEGLPYALRFYDEAGELLLEQTGTVPRRD